MRKKFGIDIDGTITSPHSFVPHINQAFDLNITLDDLYEYEITKCIDVSPEEFGKWFTEMEPNLYSKSPIADHAQMIINQWQQQHDILFISARANHLIDVTEKWFAENKINYHQIELIGSHYKVETAKKLDVDIFFEDKHDNAVDISEQSNTPVILFDTPYNRKPIPEKVIRVSNWLEAESWVQNWMQKELNIQHV